MRRAARQFAALLVLALGLSACASLYTGPPEDNEFPLNSHGHPGGQS